MSTDPTLAMCSVGELFGGVERHLLGMCSWLLRQGHVPLLILFHDNELAQQARLLGVEPIILPTRGAIDISTPRRLAAIMADHGVNVVHAHGYRAVVNCALARRHHRFALVRTVHGLVEPHGGLSVAWLKARFYTWLERFLSLRAGAVVTYVSDDLRLKHERVDAGLRTITIHNGIDPLRAAVCSRPSDFDEGVFEVVAVGRISDVKGLPYALQAVAGLPREAPVRLSIIGTGPMEQALRDQVEQNGLADRVRFLGFKKNIQDYLAYADALLMPSLHEGAPYAILEAMSLSVPIIASRTGGLPELLSNEVSGLLVGVGDVPALTYALSRLMGDRDKCRSLGEAGRVRQARRFSLDVMGNAFWALYREVMP